MTGSKTNTMNRKDVLAAVRAVPNEKDFVWDGKTEADRPATAAELIAGVTAARKRRGRPAGSGVKEQVAIRVDRDAVSYTHLDVYKRQAQTPQPQSGIAALL